MSRDNRYNTKVLGLGLGIALSVLAISMFVSRENWWFSSTLWFIPASMIILGIGSDDHAKYKRLYFSEFRNKTHRTYQY